MSETLNGLIERVTYHNPENRCAVLKVVVKARQDLVTVVGDATSVTTREHPEATGRWVVDREHGQHHMMLERNLLDTAVPRGKNLVVLVGMKKVLGMAVRRQDKGLRYMALRQRLQDA